MSGSDDRVRTARSLLLRAVESLGNGSTRPLQTNSENMSPRLQLANHGASGRRGVQREPAYESAAISMPTSKATTSAVAERNRRPKDRNLLALCQRRRRRGSVPGPTILFVCGVLPPRNHPRVSKLKRMMVLVRLMEEEEREGVVPGVGDGQVRRRG